MRNLVLLRKRLRFTRRRVIILVGVVVLVVGGVAVWSLTKPAPASATAFATASTTTLKQTVSSSGTIAPAQQANLNFAVSGQVSAVSVTAGQQVTAGQALATVNSASLAASVAEAQASVSSDQSRLSSDQTSGASTAQVNADQAAVTAAQNQLTNAQNALAQATLTSPISGTIASVSLTVGQQVSGGSTSSSGGGTGGSAGGSAGTGAGSGTGSSGSSSSSSTASTAQVVVISTGSFIVNASVDDTQVGQIKKGEQATITPNGSTAPVYGTVTSVALLASGSASVPSYPVTIGVTGTPSGLYPGASATVSIIVKQVSDAVVVATPAIHYVNNKPVVYKMVDGKQVDQSVTVGMTSGGQTQILSGLADGEQVVVPSAGARGPGSTGGGATGGTGGGTGGRGTGGRGTGGTGGGVFPGGRTGG
jgi:membrane fusion protein, macrolide-specific efflux system